MKTKENTTPESCDLINLAEAARRLGITPKTLARYTRKYQLPVIKLGTITRYDWPLLQKTLKDRFTTGT